jgi:ElaB/YqjD/DUF883 family membrane-anchored ribosome-binding protein
MVNNTNHGITRAMVIHFCTRKIILGGLEPMSKNFKRLLSITLVLSLVITFAFSTFVNAEDSASSVSNQELINNLDNISSDLYEQYPELKTIDNKTKSLLEKGLDPKQVINETSQEDLKKLTSIYKQIDQSSDVSNSSNNLKDSVNSLLESKGYNAKEYIQQIDDKAKEYTEYYKKYNKFPKDDIIKSDSSVAMTAVSYDPALAAIGYSVTSAALAEQLATLTTICATAFPYIALIALLIGATVLVSSIIYDYYDHYSDVNSKVIGWYAGTETKTRILKSSADTQTLVTYRVLYKIKYWQAFLVNFANLGGIAIGGILTDEQAIARLRLNSEYMNTYAVLAGDAGAVARGAGLGAVPHNAHTENGKFLNKPHYHPMLAGGEQSHSHSFYGL